MFAMIFALLAIAAAAMVAWIVGLLFGTTAGAAVLALSWFGLYRLAVSRDPAPTGLRRDTLNAFQQPLADD